MGNPGRAGTLPETCIFSADKNLNASVDTLDLHKLPFAGLGVRRLDVSRVAFCITDLVKLDQTRNAGVAHAGKRCKHCLQDRWSQPP